MTIQAAAKRKEEKEEYLNMLAAEEVESKTQDWQQAVDKANFKRFQQNICVRKFNSPDDTCCQVQGSHCPDLALLRPDPSRNIWNVTA